MNIKVVQSESHTTCQQHTKVNKDKPSLFKRIINSLLGLQNKNTCKAAKQAAKGKTNSVKPANDQETKSSVKDKVQLETNHAVFVSHTIIKAAKQKVNCSGQSKQAKPKKTIAGQKNAQRTQKSSGDPKTAKSSKAALSKKLAFPGSVAKATEAKTADAGAKNEGVLPKQTATQHSSNARPVKVSPAQTHIQIGRREVQEAFVGQVPANAKSNKAVPKRSKYRPQVSPETGSADQTKKNNLSKKLGSAKDSKQMDLTKNAPSEKDSNNLTKSKIQIKTPVVKSTVQTGTSATTVSQAQAETHSSNPVASGQMTASASAVAQSPAVNQPIYPDISLQLAARVAQALQRGDSTFKIHLQPPELGEVQVIFKQTEGKLHITLNCAQAQTCVQLQEEIEQLERRLSESGIDQPQVDIRHQTSDSSEQRDWQQDSQRGFAANQPSARAVTNHTTKRDRSGLIVIA